MGFILAWLPIHAGYSLSKLLFLCVGGLYYSLRMVRRPVPSPAWLILVLPPLLSAFLAPDPYLSIIGQYNSYAYGLLGLSLCVVMFYSDAKMETPAALVLSILAMIEYAQQGGRPGSLSGSPVDLGIYLSGALPLSGHPFIALALGLTGTRCAWLGALAGGAYLVGRKAFWWVIPAVLLAVLLIPPRSASDRARIEIWKIALASIQEAPWAGHGPDSFGATFKRLKTEAFNDAMGKTTAAQGDAHNLPLQILSTLGIFGLATFSLLVGLCLSFPGDEKVKAGVIAILVAGCFNPLALEVQVLGALLLGRLVPRQLCPWMGRVLALVALAGILVSARLCYADYWLYAGETAKKAGYEPGPFYDRAFELNEYEPEYARLLAERMLGTQGAVTVGQVIALNRPQDASARYIYAMSLTAAKSPLAKEELDWALELDPLFGPLKEARGRFPPR